MKYNASTNITQSQNHDYSSDSLEIAIKETLHQILHKYSSKLIDKTKISTNENGLYLSIGDQNLIANRLLQCEDAFPSFICRSYFSHTNTPYLDLQRLYSSLAPSGFLIVQEINFNALSY